MNTVKVNALLAEQALAADPAVHAWVAASAGTGKTQVLSARVLRLLLGGVPARAILCLTFTKLAAAEMQDRVMRTLAHWSRCDPAQLAIDLAALQAAGDLATAVRARRLFAQVLEAPQGLAVQTIHAFAQSLIAGFPVEAGVAPGFAVIDDRDAAALRRRLLAEAIEAAPAGDPFLADLAEIGIGGGEGRLAEIAQGLAGHEALLASLPAAGLLPMVRRAIGLPSDGDAGTALRAAVAGIDRSGVERLATALGRAGGANAVKLARELATWLAFADPASGHDAFTRAFLKLDGEPKQPSYLVPNPADAADPGLRPFCAELCDRLVVIAHEQALYRIADHAARHLRVGQRLGADFGRAKARAGVVDYGDMIAAARRLLDGGAAADWVRFKLDQRIDHVLVDEAQDTNPAQWDIIREIAREFFAGDGARDVDRRLFVVGDFKQSIYRFQGADPHNYSTEGVSYAQLAGDADQPWLPVALARNFRSVPAILTVVDKVIEALLPTSFDPAGEVPAHVAERKGTGVVTLWPPLVAEDAGDGGSEDEASAGDTDLPSASIDARLAEAIARSVAGWLDPADPLIIPSRGRPAQPEDILILVQQRGRLAGALVAALHAERVPVAGIDRLKLAEPLAVADLLALVRFVLQPEDDLTLAALLVSPFGGIDHETLYALAAPRRGSLWAAVQASDDPAVQAARGWLGEVLGFADLAAPYAFFERILSGPLQGRRRLLSRLGNEARDALDAVLDQALAFEAAHPPSLQGFLAWIEADDVVIKRDPEGVHRDVRVMTVHGAKGLQAPIVVIADACRPRKAEKGPLLIPIDDGVLPVFLPGGEPLSGLLASLQQDRECDATREYCRLLYVALTRAEDMLFIGGALAKGDPPEESWHATLASVLGDLPTQAVDDPAWPSPAIEYRNGDDAALDRSAGVVPQASRLVLPDWLHRPAPQEARPPRPLTPSALAGDNVAAPPPGPGARAAAARGSALHALFERLPAVAPARRRDVGSAWCAAGGHDPALVDEVLAVLDDPAFAAVFAENALTEAPVAAVVDGQVIAGTVDRLLVGPSEVLVVDFKTGRRVPAEAAAADVFHLRQMAAYAAALARVFPGRAVRAALLYTAGPALIEIPPEMLALHGPQAELPLQTATEPLIMPNG